MNATIRTQVRDAILATVSADLEADAVRGVEWAAVEDTKAAVRRRDVPLRLDSTLVDADEYLGVSAL